LSAEAAASAYMDGPGLNAESVVAIAFANTACEKWYARNVEAAAYANMGGGKNAA
jgi:CobQ-like glutamine amidotransferase family enzyme